MSTIIKRILLSLSILLINIQVVFSAELPQEIKAELIKKLDTNSLVVYTEDKEIITSQEHGLIPLLNYIENNSFKNTYAFDKTVGKAAAMLYVYADADYVYAKTISKPAIKVLKKHKINYEAENIINEIPNSSNTDICPFEKLVKNINNPTQAYGAIYKKINPNTPVVYFTPNITSNELVKMYDVLGVNLKKKVAVKLHSGEPGGNNFLKPNFVAPLIQRVNGTIVECNTAYEGRRNTTEKHREAIKEHGFDKIAKIDIMDADGELILDIPNGKQIKKNYVGKNIEKYNSMLVLSHFKGHQMGGFGGALKNLSIGVASSYGKKYIHGAGNPEKMWTCEKNKFLESMADADKSVMDYFGKEIVFINVMNNMSVDCDCNKNPSPVEMKDIGILSSIDPVALDKACIDLVYNSNDKGKKSLIERIESRNGTHTIDAAQDLNVGTKKYFLIKMK